MVGAIVVPIKAIYFLALVAMYLICRIFQCIFCFKIYVRKWNIPTIRNILLWILSKNNIVKLKVCHSVIMSVMYISPSLFHEVFMVVLVSCTKCLSLLSGRLHNGIKTFMNSSLVNSPINIHKSFPIERIWAVDKIFCQKVWWKNIPNHYPE